MIPLEGIFDQFMVEGIFDHFMVDSFYIDYVVAWEFKDDYISICTVFVCLIKYYLNVLN